VSAKKPEPPLVLVIDVGSSSVRANLYDRRARLVEGSQVARHFALHTEADGTAEEDAPALAREVDKVVDAVPGQGGPTREGHRRRRASTRSCSRACGVDAQEPGRLTPLYTYADTRARREAQELRRELDFPAVYQRTGCPLHTAYMPARVRLAGEDAAGRWPAACGAGCPWARFSTGAGSASRRCRCRIRWPPWSGLLDRHALQWDAALLRHLRLAPETLPPLADYDRRARGLAAPYAKRWPALRDVPFFLAVGRRRGRETSGSGCVSPDRVALTVGTTEPCAWSCRAATPPVPGGPVGLQGRGGGDAPGRAPSAKGGNVFAWSKSVLRLAARREAGPALRALPPDGHGLTIFPSWPASAVPGWANDAESCTTGMHPATSPLQVLQAWLEAVSFRVAIIARLLAPHASPAHEIVASGGAMSASPYWVQLMANVIGRRVHLSRSEELTSRGAAILALRGLSPVEDAGRTRASTPNARSSRIRPARPSTRRPSERQHRLYERVIGIDPDIGPALAAAVHRR
jgi:gluconokinase